MPLAIVFIQGLFELVGLGGFITGYFAGIWWLLMLGGCLVVLDDVIEISIGVLNPIFPVLLAIALAIVISPWYVGIFWASAAFKVLNIPIIIRKVFTPHLVVAKALKSGSGLDLDYG
jgi:hypothetical protein